MHQITKSKNLNDLSGVTITSPTNGDILKYDSTSDTWINAANAAADKMDKVNPTGTGSLSLNRKANTTIGTNSVAVGTETIASGNYSFAEGGYSEASGHYSHAEGKGTASNSYAHAEGYGTISSGDSSHAEGSSTKATASGSHAEGGYTEASGAYSHAEGSGSKATKEGAHAEGNSQATKEYAHAEGTGTTASGLSSHTEGNATLASGGCSHAEGNATKAIGDKSHTEGDNTTANGQVSHVEGYNTTSTHFAQHVFGTYNELDNSSAATGQRGNYVEIVGNGTNDNARSNARTLDWSGNETLAGDLTINGSTSVGNAIAGIPHNLDDISDVSLTTPANGEVLTYDSTAQEWINSPNVSLKRLEIQANINDTDLDFSADIPSAKFINTKYYDTATSSNLTVSEFVAETSKGRMVFLRIGTISTGTTKVLYTPIVYTDLIGGNSLTRTISVINKVGNIAYAGHYEISFVGTPSITYVYDGTVSTNLDDISDVDLSNPTDGQVIKYDATLGKWVNAAGGGGASYKILTDTLEAGHTSITFTDADILADSVVSVATPSGINPTAMTSTVGSVTFYFPSQAADITVKAVIF